MKRLPLLATRRVIFAALFFISCSSSVLLAQLDSTEPTGKAKPQVIFHLPRDSSASTESLHSQSKAAEAAAAANRTLENNSQMPLSLQMARSAASEEAQARAAAAAPRPSVAPHSRAKQDNAKVARGSPNRAIDRSKHSRSKAESHKKRGQ